MKLNVMSWKFALIAGIIGVIIDIDHYIEHIIHAKSNRFSLKATWNNAIKLHRFTERSFIHHWEGALVLSLLFLIILFFNWQISLVLAIGYYSHLLLDYPFFETGKSWRIKLGDVYVTESYSELIVDGTLLFGILCVLLI